MIHPAPESLIPYALGVVDPAIAGHVKGCSSCRAEVARLGEAAGMLRALRSMERLTETPQCLEEGAIADFAEGRLAGSERVAAVEHLLGCARCRSSVKAAGRLLTESTEATAVRPRWRRWAVPVGVAAAAALLLLLWPRPIDDGRTPPDLREPTITSTVTPRPIAPRASVARVDRLVWTTVPRAERYQVRLYDAEGSVVWRVETGDTFAVIPDSLRLAPGVPYFWKVEAQTEWRRWAASDLVEFRLTGPRR